MFRIFKQQRRSPHQQIRVTAFYYVLWQSGLIGVAAVIAWCFAGGRIAASIALAGCVVILPNLYLIDKAFCIMGAGSPERMIRSFYLGQAGKIINTAILLVLIVRFFSIHVLAFLLTLVTAQFTIYLAPWIIRQRQRVNEETKRS